MHLNVDVRDALPRITAPTLILHRVDDMLVPVTCARYMAERIRNALRRAFRLRSHVLARCPGRRAQPPAAGWESLTEAELDVVRLVAEGLTNREIAGRLFVSPRTVQTHLAHVFAKLGLSQRAEVAAETARRLS
jgi:DNA-binding NarL/FixJ family response regulator